VPVAAGHQDGPHSSRTTTEEYRDAPAGGVVLYHGDLFKDRPLLDVASERSE
jgi:hypothetical protein